MGCSRLLVTIAMSMNTCFCSPNPGMSFGSDETEREGGKEGGGLGMGNTCTPVVDSC